MLASNPSLATSVDEHQFQPIHILDMECNEDILDLLLANGADINARNDEGVTLAFTLTSTNKNPGRTASCQGTSELPIASARERIFRRRFGRARTETSVAAGSLETSERFAPLQSQIERLEERS